MLIFNNITMKARVTIIGNLTKDAENIVTKSGKEQCKFSIAVNLTKEKGFFVYGKQNKGQIILR